MLTIITPCYRQEKIPFLFNSIDFTKIDKWIIVYDTSNDRKYKKLYPENSKIIELECTGGISGNPQRNYGLQFVDAGHIYFLDDDNIIHPNFWNIVGMLEDKYFYTFDQLRNNSGWVLKGDTIRVGNIDTAMFIVHKHNIGDIKWVTNKYEADGIFITDIYAQNKEYHKYINTIACYYNKLN
jgi:hypothetical protein